MPKTVNGGHFETFQHPFFCKIEKKEGGLFGDIERICEKKSHKAENNMHKKIWSRARLEPTSFCLADLKKSKLTSMPSAKSYDLHGNKFRLCDLRSETRELSRGKKSTRTFP